MKIKNLLKKTIVSGITLTAFSGLSAQEKKIEPRNILLIFMEDMGC